MEKQASDRDGSLLTLKFLGLKLKSAAAPGCSWAAERSQTASASSAACHSGSACLKY